MESCSSKTTHRLSGHLSLGDRISGQAVGNMIWASHQGVKLKGTLDTGAPPEFPGNPQARPGIQLIIVLTEKKIKK